MPGVHHCFHSDGKKPPRVNRGADFVAAIGL
jgi:hypothetical protein